MFDDPKWTTESNGDGEEIHRGITVPWVIWYKLLEGKCERCGDVVRVPHGNTGESIVAFMKAYVDVHAVCGVRVRA